VTIRSGVVLAVLLVALAGCERTNATGQPGPVTVPSSAAAVADGQRAKVTTSDYEAAVDRLDACLKASGVQLINDGWDPVDNERMLLRFKADGMPQDQMNETIQRCQSDELEPVATQYNEDNRSHMEPALMAAVQACLRSTGIQVTGLEQNPQDLLAAVAPSEHQQLRDCVRTSVRAVYPNLYSTSFP
jgi:hypothetical protein